MKFIAFTLLILSTLSDFLIVHVLAKVNNIVCRTQYFYELTIYDRAFTKWTQTPQSRRTLEDNDPKHSKGIAESAILLRTPLIKASVLDDDKIISSHIWFNVQHRRGTFCVCSGMDCLSQCIKNSLKCCILV